MRTNSIDKMSPVELLVYNAGNSFDGFKSLSLEDRIVALNSIRLLLSEYSPFQTEPVDCVQWVRTEKVIANDYNPNSVAPPEMKLLEHSIMEDGYTQPIVAFRNEEIFEVVDGFHRNRVARECKSIGDRVHGYLPLAIINSDREDRSDRIASTIRHNRARGKHKVEAMSDIVIELKRRNWSDTRIGKELGMDQDEVLRLCQITGLSEVFKDEEFSKAWDIENDPSDVNGEILSDDAVIIEGDSKRIFHTFEKWECFKAGFYEEKPAKGTSQEEGEAQYTVFLSDLPRFEMALQKVIAEWKFSCEHYLTNERMNRIAWLGQASACIATGLPCYCRAGYNRLTEEQKVAADMMALKYLNIWLEGRGEKPISYEEALSRTEAELY